MTDRVRVEVDGENRGLRRAVKESASDIRGLGVLTRRESRAAATDVERSSRRLSSALARPRAASEGLGNSMLRLRLIAATLTFVPAIKGLSALASALMAVGGAVGPAIGGLAAIPSLLSAIVQGAGAAALASHGVGDAVKAALEGQASASKDATAALADHRQKADQVRDATRALTDAEREEKRELEALTAARADARRELQEMRRDVEANALTEERAVLAVKEARAELRRATNDKDGSELDYDDAELRVREAYAELDDVRRRNREAKRDLAKTESGGVERMPGVVQARRQLADANRATAEAARDLRMAERDAGEAIGATSAAIDKQAEAMAKLSPAAREFVDYLVSLKPTLDGLRATAAEGLFPGVERGLRDAEKLVPLVDRILGESARALGDLAAEAGSRAASPQWQRDLAVFGERNIVTIERMGDVGLDLADAMRHIMVEADPLIDWLTKSVVLWAQATAEEARAARQTGDLARFFDRARFALEHLFSIAGNLGSALGNIFKAGRSEGQGLLVDLDRLTARFDRWTGSLEGQNALKDWFRDGRDTMEAVAEAVRDIRDRVRDLEDQGKSTGDALIIALSEAFARAVGEAAEAVAQRAPAIAEGFVRGFLGANAWGKLLIGGWLLTKFGGMGAVTALGRRIAGGLTGGLAGGGAMGALGKVGGKAVVPVFVTNEGFGAGGKGPGGGVLATGGRFARFIRVAGPLTIAASMVELYSRVNKDLPTGSGSGRGNRARPVEDAARGRAGLVAPRDAFARAPASAPGPHVGGKDESAAGAAAGAEQLRRRLREINRDIARMARESGGSIEGLRVRANANFKQIADNIGLHTREGRDAARRNFREAAEGIGRSMQQGKGSTRDGMSAIEGLIKTHSRGGKEGLKTNMAAARDAIAQTMRRGGEITAQGLKLIRDLMVKELRLYGLSPSQALNISKGDGKGGLFGDPDNNRGREGGAFRAAGGFIGRPGGKGRDTVPAMLGEGEAVLNRHQQQVVNRALGAVGIGGLGEVFSKVSTPHYLARGGWVGASPGGLNPAIRSIGQWAMNKYGAVASSTLRPGDTDSFHGSGAAVDLTSGNMLAMARGIAANFGPRLAELIHTPLGYSIDNGRRTAPFAQADHYDHVHAAAIGAALAALKKIKRLKVGGPGSPLRSIVQRTLDMARAGANRRLDEAAFGLGGDIPHFSGDWVEVLEQIAQTKGWSTADWKELVRRESGGNPAAVNPTSGAFGLGQFLGSTAEAYAPYGALSKNPVEQIHAMARYIADRYGSPSAALSFHDANNWYARGGVVRAARGRPPTKGKAFKPQHIRRSGPFQATVPKGSPLTEAPSMVDHQYQGPIGHDLSRLSAAEALALLTPGTGDDMAAARDAISTWERWLPQVQAIGDFGLIASVAGNLKGARDTLAGLTNAGEDDRAAQILELTRQQLSSTRRSLALSEAHYSVFAGLGPLGSYSHGTRRVPQTGLYMLHKDESVGPDPQGPYGTGGRQVGGRDMPQVIVKLGGDLGQVVRDVEVMVDGKIAKHKVEVERHARTLARGPGRP